MNGFPPVPPSTGCFGLEGLDPAGMTTADAVETVVYVCVPWTLFLKISFTPRPPRAISPLRVTVGPGEFEHPDADNAARTATSMGTIALTVWVPIAPVPVGLVFAGIAGTVPGPTTARARASAPE